MGDWLGTGTVAPRLRQYRPFKEARAFVHGLGLKCHAILAYRNMLRVRGWIGNLCLVVECELFGHAPLNEIHGPTTGKKLTQEISRLEEVIMPLLERCHRMMARSFALFEARRSKGAPSASVVVGQAGQVNVDCTVKTEVER